MVTEIWTWVQKHDMGPSPRVAFSMAYDSASRKTIIFGGFDGSTYQADTWEWIDQIWTQVAEIGPSLRNLHRMVYDSHRGKLILFGGGDDTSFKNDTWEWDGIKWTQVANTGPSPRGGHAMVYDSSNKEILLFGGTNVTWSDFYRDTWKMKNNAWVKAQDMGPGPLAFADMVFTGSRAILFGDFEIVNNKYVLSHGTWDWKGSLWRTGGWHHNVVPAVRLGHSMAYDNHRNCVVLFGGRNASSLLNDTWELTITHA